VAWDKRPFTLGERLLTQARVVSSYLVHIFVPRLRDLGIFHDDYLISRGLLTPPSTLMSIAFLSLLAAIGFWLRGRSPAISFGILWFFAGHLLEGTVLPLELYFEHRNHLPSLGPLLALCYIGYRLAVRHPPLRKPLSAAAGVYLLTLASLTGYNASIWADEGELFSISVAEHPGSVRAGLELSAYLFRKGEVGKAIEQLERLQRIYPHDASLDLASIYYLCLANKALKERTDLVPMIGNAADKLPTAVSEYGSLSALKAIRQTIATGKCVGIDLGQLRQLQAALGKNPVQMNDALSRSLLLEEQAQTYAMLGKLDEAMQYMDRAYENVPRPDYRLQQAIWLYSAGLPEEGRRFLDLARKTPPVSRWFPVSNEAHIDQLARRLEESVNTGDEAANPR
jgi:tetratricopeptide (TPR) repeat protein